jgi:hypothetical protein
MMLQAQANDLLKRAVTTEDSELRAESIQQCERLESLQTPIAQTRKALHNQKYRTMKRKKSAGVGLVSIEV